MKTIWMGGIETGGAGGEMCWGCWGLEGRCWLGVVVQVDGLCGEKADFGSSYW